MNEIFLSYRKADSQTETLLLFEHLARRFGAEHVFQDQGIPPGGDFRAVLDERLRQCRMVLAVVGPCWLDATNKQRLHDAGDWVRRELETALNAGKPVVPVFVRGAKPPQPEDLPDGPLRDGLWAAQGRFVRADNYFASDMAAVRERVAECTGLPQREGDDAAWTMAPLPPRTLCVGREAKHAALVEQLLADECRPILVQGGPGFGKTTLTVDALHDPRVQGRYFGRCFFLRCAAAPSAAALMDLLASTFQIVQAQDREAALLRRLQQLAPLVLILDNAETPWYGQRRECEEIFSQLSAVPLCRLVLTVRGKERPVGLRWQTPIELDRLVSPFDRQMFLEYAGQQFERDAALDRLLAALAGWPMPIRLLSHQAQDYSSLTELERRWKKEKEGLLKIEGREDDAHSNFAASVELSIGSSRVGAADRRLLALLGMLPEGVCRDDLQAVLPDGGDAAASTLRKAGLAFDDGPRLRVHPFLRDYLNRRHPPEEVDRAGVLAFYLGVAREGEQAGSATGAVAIEHVGKELANVLFAVQVSLDSDAPQESIGAAIALGQFARYTGMQEPMAVLVAADARVRAGAARSSHANLIERIGLVAFDRSQHEEARRRYEEALQLYRQQGSVLGEANCIKGLADIALARSQHEEARRRFEEALPLYRQVGGVLGEANCIQNLGNIALARSQHEEARRRYEEALPLFRQVGDVLGEANCFQSLGIIASTRSQQEAARLRYEAALPLYRQVGAVLGEADCIMSLGYIALRRSQHEEARRRYEEALPLFRQVGSVLGEANCIQSLGNIALARSQHEEARRRYEEALPLFRQVGSVLGEANCIQSLGNIALARSQHEEARRRYEEALPLFRQVGSVLGEANCIQSLGNIALARSQHEEARRRYEEALPLFRQVGSVLGEANCIQSLGDIEREQGNQAAARQHFLDALELYERIAEPYSIGWSHCRLARIAESDAEGGQHVAAARAAWQSIDRPDLVQQLEDEFGV